MHRFRFAVAAFGLVLSLGISVTPALAAGFQETIGSGLKDAAPVELQGATDLNAIIGRLISAVIGFLGVVLFVYLLYGGFLYMTAAGDSKQVQKATDIIRQAIIGLVIIASAYAIANFVIGSLGNATSAGSGASAPKSGT